MDDEDWANSYDVQTSYTHGKIVGGLHAVRILKNILQDEEDTTK